MEYFTAIEMFQSKIYFPEGLGVGLRICEEINNVVYQQRVYEGKDFLQRNLNFFAAVVESS